MSTFYKRKELDQIAMLMETYQVMLRDEYLLQEKKAINLCHFGQSCLLIRLFPAEF